MTTEEQGLKLIGKLSEDMLQRYQEMIGHVEALDAEMNAETDKAIKSIGQQFRDRNRQLGQARGAFMQELREIYNVENTFTIDDETGDVYLVPMLDDGDKIIPN